MLRFLFSCRDLQNYDCCKGSLIKLVVLSLLPVQSSVRAARGSGSAGVEGARTAAQASDLLGAQTHSGVQKCTRAYRQVRGRPELISFHNKKV